MRIVSVVRLGRGYLSFSKFSGSVGIGYTARHVVVNIMSFQHAGKEVRLSARLSWRAAV